MKNDQLKMKVIWFNENDKEKIVKSTLPFPNTSEGYDAFFELFTEDCDDDGNMHISNLEVQFNTGIDVEGDKHAVEFRISDPELFFAKNSDAPQKLITEVQRISKLSSFQ